MPIQQTAKQAAINIARQAARESNEVLKDVREQVTGNNETQKKEENASGGNASDNKKPEQEPNKDKSKNLSFLDEYRRELEQIEEQKEYEEVVKRIQNGEEVPLTDYVHKFSVEQMQVLRAQMEAVRSRKEEQKEKQKGTIPQIVSKRARGMLGMIKKRNQAHVEMRQPPSG